MRITFFVRKAAEAAAQASRTKAIQDRLAKLLTPPTGPSAKAWYKMRAELDTPEHRAWIKEIMSSPTFEAEQKVVAEALGEALEAGEENHKHSVYG